MLLNRERELGYLDTRYASGRAELVILYGRRRVGKTTLVYHWARDKPHLFFFATQDDNTTLLRRFSHLSRQAAGESPAPAFAYPDWETALRALAGKARGHRFVVVIDEFPWDVHYAVYARSLAPGLRALGEQERNVHLLTPADVVGGESE